MTYQRIVSLFILLFIIVSPSGSQTVTAQSTPPPNPFLVANINQAMTEGSIFAHFMSVDSGAYFFTQQSDLTYAMWKTDGTPQGTFLVRNNMKVWHGQDYGVLNGFLYFAASDETHGSEVWRTDLTTNQTDLFIDLDSGPYSSSPERFTTFNSRLHFVGSSRYQSTDGTLEGTSQNTYGPYQESPFFEFNNSLYASEVWYDPYSNTADYFLSWFGPGGSGRSYGIRPGAFMAVYNDRLYFSGRQLDAGAELWSTSGTSESIQLVKDFYTVGNSYIGKLATYNGLLYFMVYDSEHGKRLWVTDGSEAGTIPVFDPLETDANLQILAVIQPSGPGNPGGLFFEVEGQQEDRKLWRVGIEGSIDMIADLVGTTSPTELGDTSQGILFNGRYYFHAWDVEHGIELWQSDGTVAGTTIITDINPGSSSSLPLDFTKCADWLCFTADNGVNGRELWRTDGTAGGTSLVVDLNTQPANAFPRKFTRAGNLTYFLANDGVVRPNLWRTDGTSEGTIPLNINPNAVFETDRSEFNSWVAMGSTLFFTAGDPEHGLELWRSDGTPENTGIIKDIFAGSLSSAPTRLTVAKSKLYFTAKAEDSGVDLWVSDGTSGGTYKVWDLSGSSTDYFRYIFTAGEQAFFDVYRGVSGSCELWTTNGQTTGTRKISDDLCVYQAAEMDNLLYFSAKQIDSDDRYKLYKSDGTVNGTMEVPLKTTDGNPIVTYSIYNISTSNSGVFLFARGSFSGLGLFFIPRGGTEGKLVRSSDYVNPSSITSFNQYVAILMYTYYSGSEPGTRIWISDGTATGTFQVLGDFKNPADLMPFGDTLFFSATDLTHGRQIWRVNGRNPEAQRISDYAQEFCTNSPTYSNNPILFTAFYSGLFLVPLNDAISDPPGNGCELWAYDYLTNKTLLPVVNR